MNIVFDWDGVFNDQTEYIAQYLGIPVPNEYWAREATNLSMFQQRAINSAYYDISLYRRMPLADGVAELLHLDPTPIIYSGNMSSEMRDHKIDIVRKLAPDFPIANLVLLEGTEKPGYEDADAVVEDGPHYLARYAPTVFRVLIDHAYNRNCDFSFKRVGTLREAVSAISDRFGIWK